MSLKAVFFIFISTSEFIRKQCLIKTPDVELHVIGCKDYKDACEVAKKLLMENIAAIELCGGFGNLGTAEIVKAVENKIPVGVVRFDIHPGLNNSGGDQLFM